MPGVRKNLPEGLKELENDSKKVLCLACKAHVFGTVPFQRKSARKHIGSQAHHRAIRAAAKAKKEESAARKRVRRLDAQALAIEAEAERSALRLTRELPAKPAPRTLVEHGETLKDKGKVGKA